MESVKNLLGDEEGGSSASKSLDFAQSCPSLSFKQVRLLSDPISASPIPLLPLTIVILCFVSKETMGFRNLLRCRSRTWNLGTQLSSWSFLDQCAPLSPHKTMNPNLCFCWTGNLPSIHQHCCIRGRLHHRKHPRDCQVRSSFTFYPTSLRPSSSLTPLLNSTFHISIIQYHVPSWTVEASEEHV